MVEKLTMLVADDVEVNRVSLREMFQSEYDIVEAKSTAEAMQALDRQRIDIVVLALFMSEVDGYGVLKQMKADRRLRDIPVVVKTAADENMEARMLELGADDFIFSPDNPAVIQNRVRNIMQNHVFGHVILQKRLLEAMRVNQVQRNFLNGIVTELRRPIRNLLAATSQPHIWKDEKVHETLTEVRKQAGYLGTLADDVSEMGQICSRDGEKSTPAFWLNETIAAVSKEFYKKCGEKGIRLSFNVHRWIRTALTADLTPMRTIWKSLLKNIYLNTEEGGTICAAYRERMDSEGQAILEIEVCRLTAQGENHILNVPSGSEDSCNRSRDPCPDSGNSRGIFLAESLAELMGGKIEHMVSDSGTETGFRAILPAGRPKQKKVLKSFHEMNAVIVSDDVCTSGYLAARLTRLGICCTVAGHAGQALRLFQEACVYDNGYNVCFLDWNMADEATDIAGQIKAMKDRNPVFIIGIIEKNAYFQNDLKKYGVDDLLERPLLQEKIYRLAARICSGSDETEEKGLCFAGKRVLLVEADAADAALYRGYFTSAGMECDIADSAEEALKLYRKHGGLFDAVVVGFHFTASGGAPAAGEIHRLRETGKRKFPIVAVLDRNGPEDVTKIFESGMDTFFPGTADETAIFHAMKRYMQDTRRNAHLSPAVNVVCEE